MCLTAEFDFTARFEKILKLNWIENSEMINVFFIVCALAAASTMSSCCVYVHTWRKVLYTYLYSVTVMSDP